MDAWEGDLFDRKKVAQFLTTSLDNMDEVKVLNIDAAWGEGKTYLLDHWCRQEKEYRGVVSFNAWENDYTGDPFISLVSTIRDQLGEQAGPDVNAKLNDFGRKAAVAIAAATPTIGREILTGLIRKLSGFDVDEAGKKIQERYEQASGEIAEKVIEGLIAGYSEKLDAVAEFKKTLASLIVDVQISHGADKPVYIFIDELDRCRPTYSIELLERIKHFFDVEGCKFLIATDTNQLFSSIKAVYGHDFDARRYLRRFFDISYFIDNSSQSSWIKRLCPEPQDNWDAKYFPPSDFARNSFRYNSSLKPERPHDNALILDRCELDNNFQLILFAIQRSFGFSLRDMKKVVMHVLAVVHNCNGRQVNFFWVCYLVALRLHDKDLFVFMQSMSARENLPGESVILYLGDENISVADLAAKIAIFINSSRQDKMDELNRPKLTMLASIFASFMDGTYGDNYFEAVNLSSNLSQT